jgi:hypothetical protein
MASKPASRTPGQLQRASRADVERAIARAVADLERRDLLGQVQAGICPGQDDEEEKYGAGEVLAAFTRQHRAPLSAAVAIGGADLAVLAAGAVGLPYSPAILAAAAAASGGRVAWNYRRKAKRRPRARRIAWCTWTACNIAAVVAASLGVANGIGQAVMLAGGVAVAAPYLWRHRRRPPAVEPAAELPAAPPAPEADQRIMDFAARFGSKAPIRSAEIHSVRDIRDGFQFELILAKAEGCTTAAVQAMVPAIAALYDVSADQVAVEYTETRSERRARVSVLTVHNAFETDDPWDGASTYDPETGCFRLGRYVDGEPSHWMLHKPDSGGAAGVIAGVQGSGKTGSAHVIACEAGLAKISGRRICAVWVGDPQEQPFGVWRGRADQTAWGELACVHMLLMLYFGMRARAARFGTMEWTDHLGRRNTGKGWFDPSPDEALIAAFIDEWPRLSAHPIFGPLVIALAAIILKEGRKVGITLYLMTQLPDLSELGERAIRELLKAFNALAHRTDGLSKSMLGIQGDPTKLPPGVHGTGYLNGPDRRPAAVQRTKHIREYLKPGDPPGPDVRGISEQIANEPVELGAAFEDAAAAVGYMGRGTVLDGSQWCAEVALLSRQLVKQAIADAIIAETCPEALFGAVAAAATAVHAAQAPPRPSGSGAPQWLPILAVELANRGEMDLFDVSELADADVFEAERALTVLVHAGVAVQTGPDRWRTTMAAAEEPRPN